MPGHKRTKTQREEQLVRIAEMHAGGMPQREIARQFGLTQAQICRDLKEIYQRWAAADNKPDLKVVRERVLAKLADLEKTYRKAWLESLKPKEVVSKKQVSIPGEATGEGANLKMSADRERNEASLRTEEREGNVAFLNGILACIDRECKLRGVDAPQKLDVNVFEPIKIIRVVNSSRDNPWALPQQPTEQVIPEGDTHGS
jgi:hypothetical protein